MFYIIPIFVIIVIAITVGLNVFKIIKEKSNGEKIIGKIISILGIILFVAIFIINFVGAMQGDFSPLLMFLPFIGILLVFLGAFISKLESKKSVQNNQVKLDDNGNYIFGEEDEEK